MLAALLVFTLFAQSLALAPLVSPANTVIEGSYIVVYKPETTKEQLIADIDKIAFDSNIVAKRTYLHVLKGYNARLTPAQLASVRANPMVEFVELDQTMYASQESCDIQKSAASWGLSRISDRSIQLDSTHSYPISAGEGVDIYVVDTGIFITHVDFEGRATFDFKAEDDWSSTDMNGHGTHVASTAGGVQYGVAKKVKLHAVKVLGDDGSGSNAGVIAGIDFVAKQHTSGKSKVTVINMSLGGSLSSALNSAVQAATRSGVTVVVAAGNDSKDASKFSPASAPSAICVASSDISADSRDNQYDSRSYFSNYGTLVDVFAPGSDITAAWIGSKTAVRTISGTSMASPHVAGVAALLLGQKPSLSPAEIEKQIIAVSTPSAVTLDCAGVATCLKTPTNLLYNGCTH